MEILRAWIIVGIILYLLIGLILKDLVSPLVLVLLGILSCILGPFTLLIALIALFIDVIFFN